MFVFRTSSFSEQGKEVMVEEVTKVCREVEKSENKDSTEKINIIIIIIILKKLNHRSYIRI